MRDGGGGGGDCGDAPARPRQDGCRPSACARRVPSPSAPGSAPRISSRAGVFGVMRDVARREGVAALTAGAGARVLAVAPGSAVSFFVYETIKGWLGTEE